MIDRAAPRLVAAAFVALILCPVPASAQTVGASLQGIVTDPGGAALPNAQVVVRNVATGASWELKTDATGHYRAPLVQPGDYELHVSSTGFQAISRRGIQLAVGQNAVVDVRLELGRFGEELTVTGEPPVVNLTSGSVSGLVGDKEIRELPLNGRSFQQLALLQTGVTPALAAGNDVVGGRTPKISINGARPEQNSFLLDGTDINNVYNKTPGSSAGVLLGVEAILEFQVLTNAYSAEFGRSAGGVINAVTRSGANASRGSGFEFYRNSALDAKNFFDPGNQPKPHFFRHQFGVVAGGPIVRDRTFYFGAFESLIERLGVTGVTSVPDDNARAGALPGRTVTLHPAIPAYLETLFPRDGKVDRVPANKPPISITKEHSRNQYLTVEQQHLFSPALLNTVKGGINRSVSLADNVRTIDVPPSLSWLPGEKFGYLTITGLVSEMAGDFRLPRDDYLTNWQLGDTLFWSRGAHAARFGFQSQLVQFHQNTTSQQGGIVTFPNLAAFLQGQPSNVDFAVPGLIDPIRDYKQWLFGFFAQDDVRVRKNLSLNLGLRYEFITTPTEVNGKLSNLRHVTDASLTIGGPWHSNPSLKNVAPRLGFAWDPSRSGSTAVRGGFGIFYDEILPKYYFFSGSLNPPFTTRTTIANPPFPVVTANFNPDAPIKAQLQTVNYDLQSPFIMQYNVGVQRALPGSWDVFVGYVGSRGKNLLRVGDANLASDTIVDGVKTYQPAAGRRNPTFGPIFQRVTDARSFYDSLQVSVMKRNSHGLRGQVSYTLAKSTDDSSGINSQDYDSGVQYALDWYDPTYDRGPSAFQARHNLTFNWSWEIPAPASGAAARLLGGWQLNNVTTLQTGQPFTVRLGFNRSGNLNTTGFSMNERPDLRAGYSANPVLGGSDRYWDINAFALPARNTRGNLGRNTLVGPGLVNADLSLIKSIRIKGQRAIQVPNWGRITSTVTTARQIQLGIKYVF